MRYLLETICTLGIVWIIVSALLPDPRKKQAEAERKHRELLDAVGRLERQPGLSVPPPPLPTYGSAERARVLALGKIRDGAKRHPILDAPYVRVADQPKM